jgi:hypothetical protein
VSMSNKVYASVRDISDAHVFLTCYRHLSKDTGAVQKVTCIYFRQLIWEWESADIYDMVLYDSLPCKSSPNRLPNVCSRL